MIYCYKCPVCASRREIIKPLAEIDREERCTQCASPMDRQLTAPAVLGDLPGYECPITGDWIAGRRAHEENLRKHGCRVFEPGEKEAAMMKRKDEEGKWERALDDEVGHAVASLSHERRQQLEAEIDHGFGLDVTRKTFTQAS